MDRLGILNNRNVLLFLAIVLGLGLGQCAWLTQKLTFPLLGVIMTLAVVEVPSDIFSNSRAMTAPALVGLGMNYLVLGSVLLGLNFMMIQDEALWQGFVIVAAVPPAVAVIPFTGSLEGNTSFSLFGTIGGYLAALVITPLVTLILLGPGIFKPSDLFLIMVELVLIPLAASRILLRTGLGQRVGRFKGAVTNWGFFVIIYTVVGLNQDVLVGRPLSLLPVVIIASISTFVLGAAIRFIGDVLGVASDTLDSIVLLGTLKNTGLAAGIALTLFNQDTAVPATVTTVFMIVYFVWLSVRKQWLESRRATQEIPEEQMNLRAGRR